jgi:hypothetical protein
LLGGWFFNMMLFSQNLSITKVGEWGTGQYYDIFIQGNCAYCAAGYQGLDIIDISNPSQPRKVGHYSTYGNTKKVYTQGNYSYLLEEQRGLLILDVSSPSAPYRVGYYSNLDLQSLSLYIGSIHVVGEYAYITDNKDLHVIDVSIPSSPLRLSSYPLGGTYKVLVNGQYAYFTYDRGFNIFNVSNPSQLKLIGTYKSMEGMLGVTDIFINSHYAYLVVGGFLQIIDISNPAAPKLVGITEKSIGFPPFIYVSGNYAYVVSLGPMPGNEVASCLKIIDISNPSSPTQVGMTTTYYGVSPKLFVKNNYAYVVNTYLGLQVFDVSNPLSPGLTGGYPSFKHLEGIYIRGQYAFGVDFYNGLLVLDISNPSYPVWVGHLALPVNAKDVFVSDNYAYVLDYEGGLLVINISNPAAPKLTGGYEKAKAVGVFIKGKYAYLACGTSGLKIIDVSIPSAPSLLGEYDTEGYAANVFVSGNYAYLAGEPIISSEGDTEVGGGFKILDISNPPAPVLVSTKTDGPLKYSRDVDTAYPYAYVSTADGILYILDISSPKSPVVIGNYNAQFRGDIYYSDNYVYSLISWQVNIIDVSTPAKPKLAGISSNIDGASAVFVSSGYIYVTDRTTGKLNVLKTISTSQTAQINLNRSNLYFGAVYNGIPTGCQTVLIKNSGEGQMEWNASADRDWLKCVPDSGTNSGELLVTVDVTGLSPGTYHGTLSVSAPQAANSPQTVAVTLKVYKKGNTSLPFGVFATPIEGSTVMSSITVTGWVLDDIGVQHVKIYRQEGKSLVYIGDAVFVEGARPDVEQAYPDYPKNERAGWGYMLLTNFLPDEGNGLFSLYAIATDLEGHQVTLGTKTILCDNANAVKPFGAIDTPTQGGIASGSNFVNFGWALTPLPNTIPENGSTITVWVDGIPLGQPVYNQYRKDIASLFPAYNNSNGAGGHFYLDTTRYENGVHTIAWSVKDNAGNIDGIGSRYFNIYNTGGTASVSQNSLAIFKGEYSMFNADISQIPPDDMQPICIKKGYNQNIEPKTIYPNNGNITIEIKELQRVEIHLNRVPSSMGLSSMSAGSECESSTSIPAGFQLIGERPAALPIGSFLDSGNGIFSWQPGPGYLGDYELLFIEKIGDELRRKLITLRIKPKFE